MAVVSPALIVLLVILDAAAILAGYTNYSLCRGSHDD